MKKSSLLLRSTKFQIIELKPKTNILYEKTCEPRLAAGKSSLVVGGNMGNGQGGKEKLKFLREILFIGCEKEKPKESLEME